MPLIKKRKITARQSPLRSRIGQGMERLQLRWSEWLTKQMAKCPLQTQKWLFGIFVVSGAIICTLLLFKGPFTGPIPDQGKLKATALPQTSAVPDYKTGLEEIRRIKGHVDSLSGIREGRAILDSIEQHYPGLLDSLNKF